MLTGDIGRTAVLARDDSLATGRLRLFHPMKFMLASPAEDAAEIMTRLGPTAWVEDKYDGIRAQLHRAGDEVRLFSRDLHDVSGQFPEVVEASRALAWDGILDGELLAYRDGAVLPFVALQKRLGRKSPSAAIRAEVPVIFVAFDVLAPGPRNGEVGRLPRPTLSASAGSGSRRWACPWSATAARSPSPTSRPSSPSTTWSAPSPTPAAGTTRGSMVKDPTSRYSPGRRGLGWLKMKKALATTRLRGGRGGGRPRQAPRRPLGLHLRGPRRGERRPGHDRQGLQRADRRGDRRDDGLVRGPHRGAVRALSDASSRRWWSRSPSTSSSARPATARGSRCASRGSPDSDPTRRPDEIDTVAGVEAIWRGLQHGPEHLVTARADGPVKG